MTHRGNVSRSAVRDVRKAKSILLTYVRLKNFTLRCSEMLRAYRVLLDKKIWSERKNTTDLRVTTVRDHVNDIIFKHDTGRVAWTIVFANPQKNVVLWGWSRCHRDRDDLHDRKGGSLVVLILNSTKETLFS